MPDLTRILVQLSEEHPLHPIPAKERIALMSRSFVRRGLEPSPDFFDSQWV